MAVIAARLRQANSDRKGLQRWRTLNTGTSVSARTIADDSGSYLNFSSNDYLGLSNHPSVLAAFCEAVTSYGAGSRASSLVVGYQVPHAYLSAQLAEWLEREQVLLMNSGFAANHGCVTTMAPFYDRLVSDRLIHASLIDGIRHSRVRLQRFAHNDMADLLQRLQQQSGNGLILTESVFSMDGDRAPVRAILNLIDDNGYRDQCDLMVDDAHGFGVTGPDGKGVGGEFSQAEVPLLTLTFGKAVGVAGAAIATTSEIADYLVNHCRELIYSTAFPAAQAAAISASVKLLQGAEGASLRTKLSDNIALLKQQAAALNLPLQATDTAIQTVQLGSDARALEVSSRLREQGIWCTAIRPPTVPEGQARLRIALSAMHSADDINQLLRALQQSLET
ncbi:8-amino-7-oxononanoate synthase [Pseudidiomarina sp.]|uniref:aminotransferase class I/II-fold pyridoxal phosphate-dependent enzyme n=1 Tax=Pseudidiomarina sp. TaxID=2081707 RepID=UPI00299F14B3|nr:8-amino-7-oxononanoate synthase [Pseudidiomarina sp.]MDX1704966.1 8-amino-7-oxononanoate synthase [Pseudidiomarina sp.]